MTSKFLRYEACPRCRSNGHDNRGDNLGRYSDRSGHCFSCGYHEFSSIAHVFRTQVKPNVPKSLRPSDFTREVPTQCLKWLLQYGLPYSHWKDTIGYSPAFKRLIFEVNSEEHLAFSIGRYFGDEGKRKWYVWGDSHKHCHVLQPSSPSTNSTIVLVEDLISANKVAAAGHTCIPLFGTNVHNAALYFLINENKPVVLWLDKDQQLNVKKQALQLESIINNPVLVVTTNLDPKLLSFKEINAEITI